MASVTIPEEVLGAELFVPSQSASYFEVDSGGMPNGDDCLRIRGDLSGGAHRAFMDTPTTTPNISVDGTGYSFSFWINGPTTGHTSSRQLFGIENSSAGFNPTSTTPDRLLTVYSVGTTGQVSVRRGLYGATSSYYTGMIILSSMTANWQFVVVYIPPSGSTEGSVYNNDNTTRSDWTTQLYTWTSSIGANMKFVIGGYARDNGITTDVRIGKLAFHEGELTQTQRLLLWNSMVG